MLPPVRSAVRRRLAAAGLAVVPMSLALSLPAYAAASVGVTAAADSCGVVLAVSGLGEGDHTAAVTVVSVASFDVVPALPGAGDGPAGGTATAGTAGTTATLTLTDGDRLVALDPRAVPDDDARVEVEVVLDGVPAADEALTLAACGATTGGTPTPEPTTGGTAGPAPGGSTSPTPGGSAGPTPDGTATPTPSTGPTPGGSAGPTPGGSAGPTPGGSAGPTPGGSAGPTPGGSAGPTPGGSAGPSPTRTPDRPTADPTAAGPTGGGTTGPRPLQPPRRISVGGGTTRSPADRVTTTSSAPMSLGAGSGSSGGFLGNGSSGYLPSLSWGTSSSLSAVAGPASVPAPVIAPSMGSAAATSGQLLSLSSPLDRLLGRTQAGSGAQEAEPPTLLAVPSRSTTGASDPLVDLAPAAFLLTAWLGSMLTSGRRRSS